MKKLKPLPEAELPVAIKTGISLLRATGGKKYSLILCDPPWTHRDRAAAGKRGASFKYECMTLGDICSLPIQSIAAPDCFLAMWWVPPMPEEALTVMHMWGFKLSNMKGFTWRKITATGKEHVGMGHWTRGNTEDCLFARRGSPQRVDKSVRQLISASRGEHSVKPAETRRRLEQLFGDVPRIELFARQRVAGWDAWGFEV